jgi:hypothetical protein
MPPPDVKNCLSALCEHPDPFLFARIVSSFLHDFNKSHWLATDAIESILEPLVCAASDKLSYQHMISCALLTHLRNNITDSTLFNDSSSKCCVFTPSLGRIKSRLALGSEQAIRQYSDKCNVLERILKFTLTTLKYENTFNVCHPYMSIFENDWDNLLGVVVYCVKNEGEREARILQSDLSEEVHKNAMAVKHLIHPASGGDLETCRSEEGGSGSRVPSILHLVLECMQELLIKGSPTPATPSHAYSCVATVAISRILLALERNDSSHHCSCGSILSQNIRVMLLFYMTAVVEWTLKPLGSIEEFVTKPPVSLSLGLSSAQLCQVCVYARSDDRSTQHLAGSVLQRLVEVEPGAKEGNPQPLHAAMTEHAAALPAELIRNTIFNILARQGKTPGHHGLRVILAWDLQVCEDHADHDV